MESIPACQVFSCHWGIYFLLAASQGDYGKMLFYPKGTFGKTSSHHGCSTPGCSISIRLGTQSACLKLTANKQTCFKRKGSILLTWDSLKSMEKKFF